MKIQPPKYSLTEQGEFVIDNYNLSKPFANFFPGIAGRYGIPIWVFYVNRGQAISSFGTKDKDHAILEFFPANKAWQFTSLHGFRTFLKIPGSKTALFYEPFQSGAANLKFNPCSKMSISSYGLKLEETNPALGIKIKVEYFTIPNDNFGALTRILTVQNTSRKKRKFQLIDGLPQIVPFGTNNFFLKKMSRTIEAWMNVENLEKNAPFYKLAVDPSDRPEVIRIKEGNFYLGFHFTGRKPKIIKPIVDPQCIFGPFTDFTEPYLFLSAKTFHYPKRQLLQSKTPCAFLSADFELNPSQEDSFYSLSGYMQGIEELNSAVTRITQWGYLSQKKEENKNIICGLQNDILTQSNIPEFDLYARQTYLDNIMRGGYPAIYNTGSKSAVFYLYPRKHGDLERDYNRFQLQPAYLSQGNGNYRDVNQNRRSDIWFNPDIKDENIITFFNLIQADGFNPLVVKPVVFQLKNTAGFKELLESNGINPKTGLEKMFGFLESPFTPGELIIFIEQNKIKVDLSYDDFLNLLLPLCQKNQEAEHGEGFWTDHWTYNLDLLENYLAVYPEKLKEIVFDKKVFTYFDNSETVKPRSEKYVLYNGNVRQLHSIVSDAAKKELIRKRTVLPNIARVRYGQGEIYETTLINKLLCLVFNKTTSLDPFGVGIEMEADKPNWYDSLNGLPALSGSSLCETIELKRLIIFIKYAFSKTGIENLSITEEISGYLIELNKLTEDYFKDTSPNKDYLYWDKTHSLKEEYRAQTKFGFSGEELQRETNGLIVILDNFLKKLDTGIDKAFDRQKNIYYGYFINEVSEYETTDGHHIKPLKFVQKRLPFFLEPQVHALKITTEPDKAKAFYEAAKTSPLYDKKLKMYKVTAPLCDMPQEIGRCRTFTPGWLENESIWLHMEYKYLLEILRCGLYEEFYEEFKQVLIPFQKPAKYGRSILENSSFLVSSAFPDKTLHGNGFVARLSGSTAEFISIWLLMNIGKAPFFLNAELELNLKFSPILQGRLFTQKEKTYTFNFLSKISVTYHNPKRKNTFGKDAAKINKIIFDDKAGSPVEISSDTIPSPYAGQIRSRQINRIEVYLE